MQLCEWEDIFALNFSGLWGLLARASELRAARWGDRVSLCVIINAKSGACPQDCAFCSQSARSTAPIQRYPLLSKAELVSAAQAAAAAGAARFGIVTAGRAVAKRSEQKTILMAVEDIRETTGLKVCASLGIVDTGFLQELAAAGVHRYHHNLETASSFFPQICTAHTFADRVATVRRAQEAGLAVCVGGILGLGESVAHRWELARAIQELGVDSIPLNFLHPIAGTPLADQPPLRPLEALQTIAAFRLMFPDKRIIICGGRTTTMGSLAPLIFAAGADALMTGDYLTTKGQLPEADLRMLTDLGLTAGREED